MGDEGRAGGMRRSGGVMEATGGHIMAAQRDEEDENGLTASRDWKDDLVRVGRTKRIRIESKVTWSHRGGDVGSASDTFHEMLLVWLGGIAYIDPVLDLVPLDQETIRDHTARVRGGLRDRRSGNIR